MQVLASMRTVAAYGGEKTEAARYETHLLAAEKSGVRKSAGLGIVIGES